MATVKLIHHINIQISDRRPSPGALPLENGDHRLDHLRGGSCATTLYRQPAADHPLLGTVKVLMSRLDNGAPRST